MSAPAGDLPAFDPHSLLPDLPEGPGVYRMIGAEETVLYVGKAKNLKKRVSSYFHKNTHSPRITLMLSKVARIDIIGTRSEAEALLLENNLIKTQAPRYNILFRDDKTYPYIALSGAAFPRLAFHRGRFDPKTQYFGPFPNVQAVRDALHLLQKTFLLRTCEDTVFAHRSRPCLLYQIKRCSGPCVGRIAHEAYAHTVHMAGLFLKGESTEVVRQLSEVMQTRSEALDFEGAAMVRDQIRQLQPLLQRQYIESHESNDVDLIVAIREAGLSAVNLAMVRGGRHLGDQPHIPTLAEGSLPDEVLLAFIQQHYAAHPAPSRVLLAVFEGDTALPLEALIHECETMPGVWPEKGVSLQAVRKTHEKAWLGMAEKNLRWAIQTHRQRHQRHEARLEALTVALRLSGVPKHIDCFDISHTQGEATQASCVVCIEGQMTPSLYRRYNIQDITPGDDPAALSQALERRYGALHARTERAPQGGEGADGGLWPDLILIDGGRPQVRAAAKVLEGLGLHALPVLGVAKGEGLKPGLDTLVWPDERETLHLSPQHPGLLLIQEIRDEAHRFALTGHRARRAKARQRSRLEDIPGVGPARRKALLASLGGFSGVKAATIEDLCRVKGIHQHLAEQIYSALH